MNNVIYRRDSCRLCGGRDLDLVFQLTPTPVGADYVPASRLDEVQESYPIELYLCRSCGYAGLLHVVAPGVLFNDSTEITSKSLGVIEDLRQLADTVVRRADPPKNSLVLDIGSNDGTLLRHFQNRGMKVLGVEPASYAADMAIASGVPTLPEFFGTALSRTIKAEYGLAKVIAANRVIANIDDMTDLIEGIRSLLAPDGMFVFETGYLVDLMESNLFDTIYHEHLGYYTVKPLDAFFSRHGMELVDIERIPSKGGSLRGFVQLAGGPLRVSRSVSRLIELEANLGMDTPGPFNAFAARVDSEKIRLAGLLGELEVTGKTIVGYGASVGSTTVIYHFDLGDVLSFIVDDDSRNQNLFSPGYHIPVVPPQVIYERKPDYVLIIAWRYSGPIIKNHRAYLDRGGHFIVPSPELQVI